MGSSYLAFWVIFIVGITQTTLGSIFFSLSGLSSMTVDCAEMPTTQLHAVVDVDVMSETSRSHRVSSPFIRKTQGYIDSSLLEKPRMLHKTQFMAECQMPTTFGNFAMRSYQYKSSSQHLEPIVLISGNIRGQENVLVRVHDQCFTSEVLGSLRCDCREQLHEFLNIIGKESGILIYLQQEGRGIGLSNKVAAYSLQDHGLDTVDANINLGFQDEMREYNVVPDILNDLGINSIRLVTNNPFKLKELKSLGIKITERVPLQIQSNKHNERYLKSKRDRMGHILDSHTLEMSDDLDNNIQIKEDASVGIEEDIIYSTQDILSQQKSIPSYVETNVEVDLDIAPNNANAILEARGGSSIISEEDNKSDEVPVSNIEAESSDIPRSSYAFGRESVEGAIEAIQRGEIVVVVDDENRENEGDLIMAAEKATPDTIGFIVRYTSGVLCVSLRGDRLDELNLPPMVINNEDPKQTAYSVSVDCKHNTSTGISSADRAQTFRTLADPSKGPECFQRPGHVFPLRYKPGGVLARAGHTEASLDLSQLAGLYPAGVLAEVVNDDGSLMRLNSLKEFANKHGLVLTSVQDLIAFRMENEGHQDQ
eukprot:gene501-949_t